MLEVHWVVVVHVGVEVGRILVLVLRANLGVVVPFVVVVVVLVAIVVVVVSSLALALMMLVGRLVVLVWSTGSGAVGLGAALLRSVLGFPLEVLWVFATLEVLVREVLTHRLVFTRSSGGSSLGRCLGSGRHRGVSLLGSRDFSLGLRGARHGGGKKWCCSENFLKKEGSPEKR